MESGAVNANADITLGQQFYDDLVLDAGCSGAEDTLECLRQVPLATLKAAVNMSPGVFSYRVRHGFPDPLSPIVNCHAACEPSLDPQVGWNVP